MYGINRKRGRIDGQLSSAEYEHRESHNEIKPLGYSTATSSVMAGRQILKAKRMDKGKSFHEEVTLLNK